MNMLIVFGLILIVASFYLTRNLRKNANYFLVANRDISYIPGALTIAATWTWAPAVLISAQKAYQQGISGSFWFIFPNILTLIIFAFFAMKFRNKAPQGLTLPNYMLQRYGKRVHSVYKTLMLCLNPMCFAIQLLAGGKIISFLLQIDYLYSTIIIASIVLIYTISCGLKATIIADIIQVIFIFIIIAVILPLAISSFHNLGGSIKDGLGGFSGEFLNLFDKKGIYVLLTYGLVQTIGLLAGPWGDQIYWHRAVAIKQSDVRKSFILGALIFSIIPISMAVLGFIAADAHIKGFWVINDVSITNIEVVSHLLPEWSLAAFALILLCTLASTMSSTLSSFASLVTIDFLNKDLEDKSNSSNIIRISRISMSISALIGLAIALIPNLNLLYFFLFYTVIRASTLIPTAYTITTDNKNDNGIFYGIIASLLIGTPVYAYGSLNSNYIYTLTGSIITILIPIISITYFNKLSKRT